MKTQRELTAIYFDDAELRDLQAEITRVSIDIFGSSQARGFKLNFPKLDELYLKLAIQLGDNNESD